MSQEQITYVRITDAKTGALLGEDNTGVDDWLTHMHKCWDAFWPHRLLKFEQISEAEYYGE